ncbi:hypothetical protein LEP1GSC051_3472 [Leptospira sp. P2653]|nr:hypothetical protein LEP1GSC051_3472 [Leptospira sp. P2653]
MRLCVSVISNASRVVRNPGFIFPKKSWNLNFVNLFLKCGNYYKSRFYEQILKL